MNLWCCVFRHLAATRFGRKNNPASCCPAVAPKLKTLLMAIFFQLLFLLLFSCIFACSVYVPHPHSKNLLLVSLNIASGPCNATAMTMAALGLGGFGAPGLVSLCPTFCLPLIFLLMLIIPMIDFFYQCQSGWYLHYLHYLHKYGIFLTQYTNTRFLWNTWKMEHNVVQTEDEM